MHRLTDDQWKTLEKARLLIADVQIALAKDKSCNQFDWLWLFEIRAELQKGMYVRKQPSPFDIEPAELESRKR